MKDYPKHYPFAINDVNKHRDLLLPQEFKTAKRAPAGGFVNSRIGTLTNTQIITSRSKEAHDRTLDIYYEEWTQWLTDYRLRQLTKPQKPPFTLTDFPDTTFPDYSHE
jgi:hypothetical protein